MVSAPDAYVRARLEMTPLSFVLARSAAVERFRCAVKDESWSGIGGVPASIVGQTLHSFAMSKTQTRHNFWRWNSQKRRFVKAVSEECVFLHELSFSPHSQGHRQTIVERTTAKACGFGAAVRFLVRSRLSHSFATNRVMQNCDTHLIGTTS